MTLAGTSVLATCDIDKLTKVDAGGPGSTALDSTDLALAGGTEVVLGGADTMLVTSSSVDLSGTMKRWSSSAPTVIKIDSVTGVATGLAIGTAKITATVSAPELSAPVTRSQSMRVRFKGIRVIAPTASDSISGLGQTRSVSTQGLNAANTVVAGALTADSLKSRDTTVLRLAGTTLTAKKNGTSFVVAFFDGYRDSVSARVRQVAKKISFPGPDSLNYTARHVNYWMSVPLTVRDVADSVIPSPTLTWRVSDTAVATMAAGMLKVKRVDTARVFAKADTVERGQKIVVSQVVASLTKFAGDARSDTVARPVTVLPTVTANDSGGTLIQGATVIFRIGSGLNATVTDSSQLTDALGRAKPTAWKLGDVATANTLTASSGAATATFTVTGVAGPARKLGFSGQPTTAGIGGAITPAIKVAVLDSLGNVNTTATNSITLALGNNPGAATLAGTLTVTAVAGVATFSNVTLNASGSGYTLSASAGALTAAISNGFDVFGTATKIAFVTQPSNVTTGAVISPAVRVAVQDAWGTTATNATNTITLSIATNPGGAALGGTVSAAAVAGIATFSNLTLNQVGAGYVLSAAATGLTLGNSSTFNVTTVGPAAKLAFTVQPSNVAAGASISPAIQVTVQDASGATVTSSAAIVTLAIDASANPGSSTISGGSFVTAAAVSGVATFSTVSLNKTGVGYKLTASATLLTAATSNTFNVTPGTATKLAFVQQPSHTVFSQTMTPPVTVAIQDANGNTVTTQAATSISLTLGTCSATLAGTTTASSSSGVATFSALSVATQVSNCTITAAATGLTSATSSAFSIVSATGAAKLGFITNPPASTAAGSSLGTIQVALQDASGATVTSGSSVTVTLAIGTNPGSGSLTGTLTASSTNGVVTFTGNTIAKSGTGYTLSATATGYQSGTSTAFNISAGVASKLGFLQQPTTSTAGVPFAPEIQIAVQDASGNTVTTSSASVSLQFSTGFGTGSFDGATTKTVTAVNGIAQFTGLRVKQAYTGYTLWAYSGTLSSVYSSSFNIVKAPVVLGFSTQPSSSYTAGSTISVTVQTQDSVGNLYTDQSAAITVSLTGGTAGAVLSGTTTVTPVSGSAAFTNLSVDKVGTLYQLNASASGFATTASSTFAVTPGSATKLVWIDQPQATFVNAPLNPSGQLPRIAVQDAQGNTVTSAPFSSYGTTITIAVGVGPTASFKSGGSTVTTFSMTPVNGVVTIPNTIAMNATGAYQISATGQFDYSPLTGSNSNSFTVSAFEVKSKLGFVQGPSTATVTVSITPAVTVAVQDQWGNTIPTATDAVSIAIGTDANPTTTLSGGGAVAAVNGVATFAGLSLNKTGTGYTLVASATGLASGTSGPFSVNPFVPAQLGMLVQPGPSLVGQPITPAPQVAIQDAAGNTVTTSTNTITAASLWSGTGSLSGTTSVTAVNGVGTFTDLRVSVAGSKQIRFTSSPLTGVFVTASFAVTDPPATALAFTTQPSGVVRNTAFSVAVTVRDQFGGTVTSGSPSVTLSLATIDGGCGAVTSWGTTTVSAAAGVATFNGLVLPCSGLGFKLQATSSALTTGESNTFDVAAYGTATQIGILMQPGASLVGQPITPAPQVAIQDAAGNTVGNWPNTVTASQTGGAGTLSGTLSVGVINGVATFTNLRVSAVGSPQLRFASSPLTGVFLSTSFAVTLTTPVNLVANGSFTSGSASWTTSGAAFVTTSLPDYYTAPGYAHLATDISANGVNNATGVLYQDVTIPAGGSSASLEFRYNFNGWEATTTPFDYLTVTVRNTSNTILATVATYSNMDYAAGQGSAYYSLKTFDMTPYIGQTVRIYFLATSDNSLGSVFRIDDVKVTSP